MLTYYGDWYTLNTTLEPDFLGNPGLFVDGDGQCGAWNWFFIRCMHAVGIDPLDEWLTLDFFAHISGAAQHMLVNNWDFAATSNPDPTWSLTHPHVNIPVLCPFYVAYVPNFYTWFFADVRDVSGVSGQGPASNPLSLFDRHFVTIVGSKIYDPSYGVSNPSFGAYEASTFAGYALSWITGNNKPFTAETDFGVDLNCDGFVTSTLAQYPIMMIQMNPNGNQLRLTFTDRVR